jgi:TetR/AcrR family transcriptional regulator, cholesterol catabolism regulator
MQEKANSPEKEYVMEVAANLFGSKGYSGTSMRDVAAALDVSISTTYYYFKNKEDLLFQIAEKHGRDMLSVLNKTIELYKDPLERLHRMIFNHVCFLQQRRGEIKVYAEEQVNLSGEDQKAIRDQQRMIYQTYVGQLEGLKELGLLRIDQPRTAAFALFGMVNWTYRWFKQGGEDQIRDVANILVDLFLGGLLNDKGRRRIAKIPAAPMVELAPATPDVEDREKKRPGKPSRRKIS